MRQLTLGQVDKYVQDIIARYPREALESVKKISENIKNDVNRTYASKVGQKTGKLAKATTVHITENPLTAKIHIDDKFQAVKAKTLEVGAYIEPTNRKKLRIWMNGRYIFKDAVRIQGRHVWRDVINKYKGTIGKLVLSDISKALKYGG